MDRILGEGWELGVFRVGDGLVLGIPVESGHRNFSFEFVITAQDLAVLEADPYRRKALDLVLHAHLQPRLTRGDHAGLEAEIQPVIRTVLHAPPEAVEQAIDSAPDTGFIRHHLGKAAL